MDYRDLASDGRHGLHPHPSSQHTSRSTSPASPGSSPRSYAHTKLFPIPDSKTPRTLHVYLKGVSHTHIIIADEDETQPLYTVDHNSGSVFSSSPHMSLSGFHHADNSQFVVIGTANIPKSARSIALGIWGRRVEMYSEGHFTHSFTFMSPTFRQKVSWETEGVWGADLVLVNAQREWIARFDGALSSPCDSYGQIHIVDEMIKGSALDEIVTSGCAYLVYLTRRRGRTSAGGGAATGGAY